MVHIQLNSGIYHPMHNKFGWKCRYVNGANHLWHEEIGEEYKLDSMEKCFDEAMIYSGSDNSIKNISGREDGLIMTDTSGVTGTIQVEEWE